MHRTVATLVAALVLAVACGMPTAPGEWREVLPDDRILVNMPVETAAERDGAWSEYYLLTAEVTTDVNHFVGGVLYSVDTLTDYPPSEVLEDGTYAIWGPWTDGPLDPNQTRLWVRYDAEADAYTWGADLQAKNTEDPEEWVNVIAGEVDPGATHEVNSGRFTVDFDTIHEMRPIEEMTGFFTADYEIDEAGVRGTATLSQVPDEFGIPFDAVYVYEQIHGGNGYMDLLLSSDITGNTQAEALTIRSRWLATGAGRSDAHVTDGDLGETVYTESECWDTSFEVVYNFNDYEPAESGDPALCAFESFEESGSDSESVR